jgi:Phage portal protein, SPP1 Gp6-like
MSQLNPSLNNLRFSQEDATSRLRAFVKNSIINGSETDEERIANYELYWQFYLGNHWRQYNRTMMSFNYVRAFVDKVSQFLIGKKAFSFQVGSYSSDSVSTDVEEAAESLLRYHWNKNNRLSLSYSMTQMGSITGDLWLAMGWNTQEKFVEISVLDSRQCFPRFDNGGFKTPTSFIMRQPLGENANKYVVKVTEYANDSIATWFQKTTSVLYRDRDKERYELTISPNPLGFIPIVHIQNKPNSAGYYGISDVEDVLKLNKVYNELAQELKAIIDYYTAPTTIVTGATLSNMSKKLGNVWSGLPAEANVYNLGLDVDLTAAQNFLAMIKTAMHEMSDVPENFLGKIQAISNTSAAALQLTYQPIVQQADMKWLQYGIGIEQINKYTCKFLRVFDSDNKELKALDKLVEGLFEELYKVEPVFSYGFPQDKQLELTIAQQELSMRLNSRRRIMNRLGVNNTAELIAEIEEDVINQARMDMQVQTILTPQIPSGEPTKNTAKNVVLPNLKATANDFLPNDDSTNGEAA